MSEPRLVIVDDHGLFRAGVRAELEQLVRIAGEVAVYAELSPERSQVFVRDRGDGFDPDAVPADRRGVRESIIGRMERSGGTARIRSGNGGTEVELTIEPEAGG